MPPADSTGEQPSMPPPLPEGAPPPLSGVAEGEVEGEGEEEAVYVMVAGVKTVCKGDGIIGDFFRCSLQDVTI